MHTVSSDTDWGYSVSYQNSKCICNHLKMWRQSEHITLVPVSQSPYSTIIQAIHNFGWLPTIRNHSWTWTIISTPWVLTLFTQHAYGTIRNIPVFSNLYENWSRSTDQSNTLLRTKDCCTHFINPFLFQKCSCTVLSFKTSRLCCSSGS
jgi:hypothetical protein